MIVSASMLPGRGMTELSAKPSRISPSPPSRSSHAPKLRKRTKCTIVGCDWRGSLWFRVVKASEMGLKPRRQVALRKKLRLGSAGENPELMSIAEEQPQSFQVFLIERVIHVFRQVIGYELAGKSQLGRPRRCYFRDVLQPVIARLLKHL